MTTSKAPRICLVHAVHVAIGPIEEAFARLWPEAELMNLLDDRLAVDRAGSADLSDKMIQRFLDLGDYALSAGADGVLFTCSAFGPAIEAVQARLPVPVFKPNEAMFEKALLIGRRVGLLTSFEPASAPMVAELEEMARAKGIDLAVRVQCVPEAMRVLNAGHGERHDDLLAGAVPELEGCDVIVLGQFSTARARAQVFKRAGCPVLTSPEAAVKALRSVLEPGYQGAAR